jgi:hypothetical protein
MIDRARVRQLSERVSGRKPRYVLYWMQASQRVAFNHALELTPAVCEFESRTCPQRRRQAGIRAVHVQGDVLWLSQRVAVH